MTTVGRGIGTLTTGACTVAALPVADVPFRAFVPVPSTVTEQLTAMFLLALTEGRVHVGLAAVASSSVPSATDHEFPDTRSYPPPASVRTSRTVVPSFPLGIAVIVTVGAAATAS